MDTKSLLKNVSIFKNIPDHLLEKITPLARTISFQSGATIISEGSAGSSMYLLTEGKVKVTKKEGNENDVLIAILESGSYFGELSLLDDMPRSADVTAIEPSTMLHIKKADFDLVINNNIEISNAFYKNCLNETFFRFRTAIQNLTFCQTFLDEKSETLSEINRDLSQAKEVQNYFIDTGDTSNNKNNIHFTHTYDPCIEIGGDFFNITPCKDGSTSIIIADVVGHGITAAMATGVIKSTYTLLLDEFATKPGIFMEKLNKHYSDTIAAFFATCYYASINHNATEITFSKGGHPHPLIWNEKRGDFVELNLRGVGVGIMNNSKYTQLTLPITPGDKVLFYTDGIVEQHNKNREMFSLERLQESMRRAIFEDVPEKLEYIKNELVAFQGNCETEDDITLLLVEF